MYKPLPLLIINNHYIISVVVPGKLAEGGAMYWSGNPLILKSLQMI